MQVVVNCLTMQLKPLLSLSSGSFKNWEIIKKVLVLGYFDIQECSKNLRKFSETSRNDGNSWRVFGVVGNLPKSLKIEDKHI